MTNAVGRPIAPFVLSSDERTSSSAITKSPSRIDGPNPQMKFARRLSAFVRKPNRHYAANFKFR